MGSVSGISVVIAAIVFISVCGCATCGTSYRRELSDDSRLAEANTSYKKAITWLDKAECSTVAGEASRFYATAESYISDAIFKLQALGHDKNIDVSQDIYYCERIKRKTSVKMGAAERAQ